MRDLIKRLILFSLLSVPALSCVNEDFVEPSVGDGEAIVDLHFGFSDFDEVKVETRATMDIVPESRVSNLYAVLFVNGKRYYSHYFHKGSLAPSKEDMDKIRTDCWYVIQKLSHSDGSVDRNPTNGWLRFVAPECSGGNLYLIANLDADMVNVSNEKLNMIDTEQDLLDYVVNLNQEITSRNGLFPMVGSTKGVNISATGGITGVDGGDVEVHLERLDAKVAVNVRCATGYELESVEGTGTTTQRLKEFRPESWCVVNLPKGEYLLKHDNDAEEIGYFSTEPVKFETSEKKTFKYWSGKDSVEVASDVSGFSFYMLENREKAKKEVSRFHQREYKNKDSNGFFDTTDGVWTNAPENGTYMVIKGELVMDVDVSSEAKQQQLAADVVYYIHLGDISKGDFNDYKIERNTYYTYNITIKGVNSIEVEVSTSHEADGSYVTDPDKVEENEPGAEGMVYVAKESMYTFDAHYGQRVFCFDAAYIDTDALTWYVKTPFGREGTPDKIGDVEIPSGMDYEWVHFMVNKISDSNLYKYVVNGSSYTANLNANPYSRNNQAYPGDDSPSLMNVVEFVEYIKTQKKNKDAGRKNDFRTEFDQEWFNWYNNNNKGTVDNPETEVGGQPWFRDRIYVTVFVDEFYYEKDPITGETSETLWKRFVNQPNRMMHILCDNVKSLDGASSSTGSVVTIRQRSIQTPYNITNPEVVSAWGCETEDENADSYFWYFPEETDSSFPSSSSQNNLGNNSVHNGLYNTARMWGCASGSAWKNLNWSDFLDYDRPNDYCEDGSEYNILFLKKDYAGLRYSAMMRNRDNNGNGVIDPDEIRWYNASIGQLEYLYLGELGLSDDAAIYSRKYSSAEGVYDSGHPFAKVDKWKCHVVSSTSTRSSSYTGGTGYVPQVLWAEEGVSVSGYKQWSGETGPYVVKCVRNLGLRKVEESDFQKEDNLMPQELVTVTKPEGTVDMHSVYKFDASRINSKSMRFYTTVELEPSDEFNEMSRLYTGFETGELVFAQDYGIYSYYSLYQMIRKAESPCPEGYRVPNMREGVLMYLLADSKDWWIDKDKRTEGEPRIFCSTYYSLGYLGSNKNKEVDANGNEKIRYSWNILSQLNGGNINLTANNQNKYIRCVRDWNPSTSE